MPDILIQGSLAPQDVLGGEEGAAQRQREQLRQTQQAVQKVSGRRAEKAIRAALGERLRALEGTIAGMIDQERAAMATARQTLGFDARFEREVKKYRNEPRAPLNDDGTIEKGRRDSHLTAGVTTGLFIDACNVLPPQLGDLLLGYGRRPYELEASGRKAENDVKTKLVSHLLDASIEQSQWRGETMNALRDLPKHGTCFVRQSWVEQQQWVRTREGLYAQQTARRGMSVKHWDLRHCYVSNPVGRRNAWEQDAVIFYSRSTLSRLAANERVFDVRQQIEMDPVTGEPVIIPIVAEAGRFYGLERIRVREADKGLKTAADQAAGSAGTIVDSTTLEEDLVGYVSSEDVFDIHERQGYFPIGALLRSGDLTPQMLEYLAGGPIRTGKGSLEVEELARLCDGLIWYITIASGIGLEGPILLECQPCRYRRPRNELLSGVLFPDGNNFYGLSLDRLGEDIEDTADRVLNDIVRILGNNADPPVILNTTLVDNEEKARRAILEEGAIVETSNANAKAGDLAQYMLKPYDRSLPTFWQQLAEVYNVRCMTNPLSKGGQATTESDTLGEGQEQLQGTERRLADAVRRLAEEQLVRPSIVNLLDDIDWFYADRELEELATRVAGQLGLEAATIFPTAESDGGGRRPISEEFQIKTAAAAAIEKQEAIRFAIQMLGLLAADPRFDVPTAAKDIYGLAGMDGDRYFIDPMGPMAPWKEFSLILAGDRPNVNANEMAGEIHLPAHQQQRLILEAMLQKRQSMGESTEAIEGWVKVLEAHLMETVELAGAQQILKQQQMAQAAAASPAARKPKVREGEGQGGRARRDPNQARGNDGAQGQASGRPTPAGETSKGQGGAA
jgi:hypothetical protein